MALSIGTKSRLKSKKKIELLFKNGKRLNVASLGLRYLDIDPLEGSQFGFSVPKKIHPLAVHRNKIKRLMRECLRVQNSPVQKGKLIMFIYTGRKVPEFEVLCKNMNALLKKLPHETS